MESFEEWKPVFGAEHYYLISSEGRLKNKRTGKILKPSTSPWGYRVARMSLPKRGKISVSLSRLILTTFHGEELKRKIAWHKNGKRWDSRLQNLEPVTKAEAQKRLWAMGWNRPPKIPLSHLFKPRNRLGKNSEYTYGELLK